MIKGKGLIGRIHLKGIRSDISSVMNGIDLFMLSSVSEAFPSVLNESMACGTPCVTTDVGDAAIIVGNTGWIVRPKDPEALANALTHAMKENQSDNELWLKRKDNCRKRIVENFSLEKMVKKYKQAWLGE
jgi:glycosyltransferase involved in cell wall biosynthesis